MPVIKKYRTITDADIPPPIARDAEVTAAMNAHLEASDPHSQYLLPSEGDARYRQSSTALTASDMPSAMATDAEVTAAMNAHLGASDPHSQYLLPSEGDARYRLSSTAFFATAPLPPGSVAGNSIALSWNSVQPGQGIAELCNYAGLGGGDAFNFFRMPGNSTATPSLSHRLGRIDLAGAYVQSSDRRLKNNLSSAPGIEVIMKIKPLLYTHWACDGFDNLNQVFKLGQHFTKKIGFIAQDLQRDLPEAVSVPYSNNEPWGIDYNCVLAVAVRAIQQQEERLNDQQKQIADLLAQLQQVVKDS